MFCVSVSVRCCSGKPAHTQEEAQEQAFLAVVAQLRDSAESLEQALLSGTVTRWQADALRGHHRATTQRLLELLVSRQLFERSPGFSRSGFQRSLRASLESPAAISAAADRATRLTQCCEALLNAPLKQEETCSACAYRAAAGEDNRSTAACFTARAVKRPRLAPTPHPRAGPDAVVAAGGVDPAVQQLLDEQTDEEVTGAVFSSTEEEEESSSDTD